LTHPASYPVSVKGSFPTSKVAEAWSLSAANVKFMKL
jgi:hypothetical protein